MKKVLLATAGLLAIAACDDATVASHNLSKAADNFEIPRRTVFYNGITDAYILEVEGLCSINEMDRQLELTCKIGDRAYKKHFLGLSDNVTYFSEQVGRGEDVSRFYYRVTFKPQVIIPDVDLRTSVSGKSAD